MLSLDQSGWILSPKESYQDLLYRKKVLEDSSAHTAFPMHEAHIITKKLFDFYFATVPIFVSQTSLLPWQGAVLWSYANEQGKSFPVIQISPRHLSKQGEIVAHELVHAARFAFRSPIFEEILAFQTSSSFYRRFLGPLFLFSWEPLVWLLLSFICFFLTIFTDDSLYFSIPFLGLGILFLRLLLLQSLFFLAKKNLHRAHVKHPLALLLRLSDAQIGKIAFCFSPKKLSSYLHLDSRFKEIISSYFSCQ